MTQDAGIAADPFGRRSALALVLFGSALFVALLWMIGSGLADSTNDGGAHADGRGLNGYAAFADYLDRRGFAVRRARSDSGLRQAGLLVLTPPANMDGRRIDKVVAARRSIGPTLVVTPKWAAVPSAGAANARSGWVRLLGPQPPVWRGFLDDVTVDIARQPRADQPVNWAARDVRGRFPEPRVVMSGTGPRLVPLVMGKQGRIHAAYLDDGRYPHLAALAPAGWPLAADRAGPRYPLIIIFDPDLLDNYGMAQPASARLGEALARAAGGDGAQVTFDLTFNGLARSANLLTLAFEPPFLAATLCLLLAAGCIGWRSFLRFGPPRQDGPAIGFGKQALVRNAAGLIRRSNRLHLLGAPYADAARQRLARAFALNRRDSAGELAALDRAALAAGAEEHAFSQACARLARARSAHDLVKAAQDLHALERTLTR